MNRLLLPHVQTAHDTDFGRMVGLQSLVTVRWSVGICDGGSPLQAPPLGASPATAAGAHHNYPSESGTMTCRQPHRAALVTSISTASIARLSALPAPAHEAAAS